jgi:hypothetical protein
MAISIDVKSTDRGSLIKELAAKLNPQAVALAA